jgi:3-dehydroquinate synthase
MYTLSVNLGLRAYPIALVNGATAEFGTFIRSRLPQAQRALIVSDTNTAPIGQQVKESLGSVGISAVLATVPAGEESKSLAQLAQLYDVLHELKADRTTPVIAVGGGVVGDLSGFAAATYNRGLPLLMVPTSLLAMVDSSVGGKTGINHPGGKNLIGAFHQPVGVWIDIAHLAALPPREFRSGLAEVVKYGVSLDAEFFSYLEANVEAILARDPPTLFRIISRSCRLKADVVEKDEREETGLRAVLNYGHTFAHAFETVSGYGVWLHGEAVAVGMVCASRLAERLSLIDGEVTQRQIDLLERFLLPRYPQPDWSPDELLAVMQRDKKAQAGKLRFVLPTRLGEVRLVSDVPESLVRAVLEKQ